MGVPVVVVVIAVTMSKRQTDEQLRQKSNRTFNRLLASLPLQVRRRRVAALSRIYYGDDGPWFELDFPNRLVYEVLVATYPETGVPAR